jgi:hypothetical protein
MPKETAGRRVFNAPVNADGPVPAFKVVEWNVPVPKTVYTFDEKTRTLVAKETMIEGGYMVLFPRGHVNFYDSLEALEAAGLGDIVPLINMNHGESEMSPDAPMNSVQRVIEKANAK